MLDNLLKYKPFFYYIEAWKKIADFKGRSRRYEFWSFMIINVILSTICDCLDLYFFGNSDLYSSIDPISTIFELIVLVPTFAVSVRRLHDTDRSAWYLCWYCLPLIGDIIMLIYTLQRSDEDSNTYGLSPIPEDNQEEIIEPYIKK
jgi:uncharacterized membrane protein YhaH (DUF805 family)